MKVAFIIAIVIMILNSGFRYFQGADYNPYLKIFSILISSVRWNETFDTFIEPTYVIISKIIGKVGLPFFFVTLTFAALSLTLKGITWYKYSPYPFLTLLLFYCNDYFFGDMGHIRQAMATAFCIFSLRFIIKRKKIHFLICVFTAYLFHKTAIVFLPAYWIANLYITNNQWILLLGLSLILWQLKLYELLGSFLGGVAENSTAFEGYAAYSNLSEVDVSILNEMNKITLILIILYYDKTLYKTTGRIYMIIRNLTISFFFLYYSLRGNEIFALRLPTVYFTFIYFLLPIMAYYSTKGKRIFLVVFIIIYSWVMMSRFGFNNAEALGFDRYSNAIIDGLIFDPTFASPRSID